MISVGSSSATDPAPTYAEDPEPDDRRSRRSAAPLVVRRLVQLALSLVVLWLLAVFWLGLIYTYIPPVSTLMLGRWFAFQPIERKVVSLNEMSPHLPLAVMASEDARFCLHSGIDWDELREAVDNADEDSHIRGASTIPMQTAKNLFLWPSRSYFRKGLELPVALYLDMIWSKPRMMENYLNIAEWGEGIFGAEAAARHYFGKSAKNLSRREAVLLATALPNPFRRDPARPGRRHRSLAERLLARMEATVPYSSCLKG